MIINITFIILIILSLILVPLLYYIKNKKTNITPTIDEKLIYKNLLQNPNWKAKKIKILNRDNYCCRYCGSTKYLKVHHKYYSRYPNGNKVMPWNYPDDALITLCWRCHNRVHLTKKIKLYYRRYDDNYQ